MRCAGTGRFARYRRLRPGPGGVSAFAAAPPAVRTVVWSSVDLDTGGSMPCWILPSATAARSVALLRTLVAHQRWYPPARRLA
jgi:hypothetical protein